MVATTAQILIGVRTITMGGEGRAIIQLGPRSEIVVALIFGWREGTDGWMEMKALAERSKG
jgi:hypothetical protein